MDFYIEPAHIADANDASKLLEKITFSLGYLGKDDIDYYNPISARNHLIDYISEENKCLYICKGKPDGKIIGLLMAHITVPFLCIESYRRAQDVLLQPDPDLTTRQKSEIFLALIQKYEDWAREKGVKEMFFGVNVRNDITASLGRKGFEKEDIILRKEF